MPTYIHRKYVESPDPYIRMPDSSATAVFLAGGITGCPDWQQQARRMLIHRDNDVIVLNPRRAKFDPLCSGAQIRWEFDHLAKADHILFWFCANQIQPIALYELGRWAHSKKPITVGCHRDYPRRLDVKIQLELARPELHVWNDFEDTVNVAIQQCAI